ncbi:hypothetical protein [Methanococcoides methylutens]|uniref:hypothetical protein n=1 Tax=Methanococcoides methylutens TaxID=2226 RepID=UPI0013641213|nr:hypothetical protein [Methanococcoides methylutens]
MSTYEPFNFPHDPMEVYLINPYGYNPSVSIPVLNKLRLIIKETGSNDQTYILNSISVYMYSILEAFLWK